MCFMFITLLSYSYFILNRCFYIIIQYVNLIYILFYVLCICRFISKLINISSVEKSSLCGAPANSSGWHDFGMIHTATFTASGALYYIFGDDLTNDWSEEFKFTPPPAPGVLGVDRPARIALLADMGLGSSESLHGSGQTEDPGLGGDAFTWTETGYPSYNCTQSLGRFVDKDQLDAVFLNGDISYANGYLASWDFYLNMITPFSGRIAFMNTVGNEAKKKLYYKTSTDVKQTEII